MSTKPILSFPAIKPSVTTRPRDDRRLHIIIEPLTTAVPPAAFLLGVIVLWSVLSHKGTLPSYLLPSPQAIAQVFVTKWKVLLQNGAMTCLEAVSGFVIGNVMAVLAAALLTFSKPLREAFYPYALVSRATPVIVFTPAVVVLMGRGLPPIIAIVSFTVYFPTFLNMIRGLKSAKPEYYEMLHTLSASPLQRLLKIELPASLPYLFAALKVSASASFISALVTEWIGANRGLGYLVVVCSQYFRLPLMWASIFTAAALTLTLLGLVHLAEHGLSRYTSHAREMGK